MKTTSLLRLGLLLTAVLTFSLTGCKKDEPAPPDTNSASVQQLSMDDNAIQMANDEALADVNGVLYGGGGGGLKETNFLPCNATVDSANVINDTITYYITYNGLNCPETVIRTGKVEIRKAVGTHWWMPGATVKVTYLNLKSTRVSDGKFIILNGSITNQNVTGGHWFMLGNGLPSIVHKHWGTLNVTFFDNTTAMWHVARQQTYTGQVGPGNTLVMAIDGFGTEGTYTNLESWGTDRSGAQFYISISESVVHRQACGWDPCSGVKTITYPEADMGATITFGFDVNNQPVTPPECPVKFRVDWYMGADSGTVFLFLH